MSHFIFTQLSLSLFNLLIYFAVSGPICSTEDLLLQRTVLLAVAHGLQGADPGAEVHGLCSCDAEA